MWPRTHAVKLSWGALYNPKIGLQKKRPLPPTESSVPCVCIRIAVNGLYESAHTSCKKDEIIVGLFVPTVCPIGRVMWGMFEKGYLEQPGLHAVLTVCLRDDDQQKPTKLAQNTTMPRDMVSCQTCRMPNAGFSLRGGGGSPSAAPSTPDRGDTPVSPFYHWAAAPTAPSPKKNCQSSLHRRHVLNRQGTKLYPSPHPTPSPQGHMVHNTPALDQLRKCIQTTGH